MRHVSLVVLVAALLAALAAGFGCGGRPSVQPPPADLGVVAGRVFKGPVSNSTVTVYRLDGATRGANVGSATTDADGAFRVPVGTATGPFIVVASGGSFVDEATGVTVQLNSAELTALVPAFEVETKLEALRITPVSHLAATLALRWVANEGATLAAADSEAWQHLNVHFGGVDWRYNTPTDVTSAAGATLDDPAREGLLLAALSMQSRLMSDVAGLTPGGRINPLLLTEALADDLAADGFLDGVGARGPLVLPAGGAVSDAGPSATALDGQTARTALAQAIAKFLASDRNVTHISLADAQQLITAISTNADPRIFRGSSGPADVEPPVIAWVKPAIDNTGVRGSAPLEVRATDNVAVQTFVFTAPASLAGTAATPAADGKGSILATTWDVSSLADGPVTLTVKATDTSGNVATKSITVLVSNRGPTINVSAPSDGAVVKGLVPLSASATAQSGSIAKLELRAPPAGMAADTLPAADTFFATWDSTQALEGPLTLTFHAEDTLGGVADIPVTVTVDNVPFGTVKTTVSLGAPVGGLAVQLLAIDDTTGQPVVGRAGGAVLGATPAGTTTDATTGVVVFALSQENYEGPVQLVASGPAASYTDPTDSTLTITLPATLSVTAFVPHYKTGTALDLPVTGWTTLADAAALAYAQGKNPTHPTAGALTAALGATDLLFPAHVSRPQTWPLRTTFPVSLVTGTQSLRDVVYAALPDVGLNQLARDIAGDTGLTPGTGYALPLLLDALSRDLSDGQFDGKAGSLALATGGSPSYAFDAQTTRFRLATSMDRFIRSSANKTGLGRADLQTSGVYDDVSSDTSILYPNSVAPIPFDNVPPVVVMGATWSNGTTTAAAPVGSAKIVSGTLALDITAADSSGVASLVVSVGGTAVTPGAGSTATHFTASVPTTSLPDGALTITAASCDKLANCGSSSLALTVDNTPPTITIAAPVAGFYSASVSVDATATDTSGVQSFLVPSLSGFVDADPAVGRIFGTWTFLANQLDGALLVVFTSCDVVANCSTAQTLAPIVDRTPPTLTWVAKPVAWTNGSAPLTASVSASDGTGAGVAGVYFKWGSVAPVLGTLVSGVWSSSSPVPPGTATTLLVWAVDQASPSNSGAASSAPTLLSFTTAIDTTPPQVAINSLPSYVPEMNTKLVLNAQGHPVVPVQYQDSGAAVAIDPVTNPNVFKLATRLHAADGNVAILTYRVATSSTKAPLSSVTLTNNVAGGTLGCTNLAGCVRSHPLTLSTRTAAGYVYYDLPLTSEMLDARTSAVSLKTTFTDVAGNVTNRTDVININPLAPPVYVADDTSWSGVAASDPQSVYVYRLSNQSFPNLFSMTNSSLYPVGLWGGGDSTARVVRYVIENPAPYPVAVNMPITTVPNPFGGSPVPSSAILTETWTNTVADLSTADAPRISRLVDGFTLPYYANLDPSQTCTNGTQPYTCTFQTNGVAYTVPGTPTCGGDCWHIAGSTVSSPSTFSCFASNAYSWLSPNQAVTTESGVPTMAAFSDYQLSGNEKVAATRYKNPTSGVNEGAIVPAASGTTPGRVVFYYKAPLAPYSRSDRSLDPLAWTGPLPFGPNVTAYQYTTGYAFKYLRVDAACGYDYHLNILNRTLASASWVLSIGASIVTSGFGDAAPTTPLYLGAPTGVAALPVVNRSWAP